MPPATDLPAMTRVVPHRQLDITRLELRDIVFVTDADGVIVDVNDAFVKTTGYSREEAIGSTPRLLRSGIQRDEVYAALWQTIKAGKVWEGELVDRRRDGALRTHRVTISPMVDGAGQLTGFVAVERDLTSELDREGPTAATGVAHTDANGRCVYADERSAVLLGRTGTTLFGAGFLASLADGDADEVRDVIGMAIDTGRDHRVDVRTVDGRWLQLTVAPLRTTSSDIIGARLGLEDVTGRLMADREVARHEAIVAGVLGALDEPVAIVAGDGHVVATNDAWDRQAGADPAADLLLAARTGDDLLGLASAAAAHGERRAAALERSLGEVLRGLAPTRSTPRGVHISAIPWDDGGAVVRVTDTPTEAQGRSTRQSASRRSSLAPSTSSASTSISSAWTEPK